MAVNRMDDRRPNLLLSRLHFLVRLLGLCGAQAALVGLVVLQPNSWQALFDDFQTLDIPKITILAGAALVLLALFIEVIVGLRLVAGRRSLSKANALVQVGLAAALLIGANVWSFGHSVRLDWTRDQRFTLPPNVVAELAKLDPQRETTIVLYQRHRSADGVSEKPDPFDLEAERKVVEKVKDLVDLFREVGPQFRVEVLDVGSREFAKQLDALAERAPELKLAIEQAPENSIFIQSGSAVQRLGFSEFFRLDRNASEKRDNLVLREIGPGPILEKIVRVEERRPRVGILVAHEALSSEGPVNLFTLAGARKILQAHGFDVRDVVLRGPNGEPAADALAVSKLERLQDELDDLDAESRALTREIALVERIVKGAPSAPVADVNRLLIEYAEQFNPRFLLVRINEANRDLVGRLFGNQLAAAREGLELAREERASVAKELAGLSTDRISEQRRLKDLRARLARNVADVDLLFIPRLTLLQSGDPIARPAFHDLDARHSQAVRAFLEAGKPVLACLGPTNMPAGGRPGADSATKPHDDLERLFAELGILFGKRTVVFNVEKRAFAGRDENMLRASKPLQVPPLRLERPSRGSLEDLQQQAFTPLREPVAAVGTAGLNPLASLVFVRLAEPERPVNPVRQSLQLADKESGRRSNLRLRFLRPVFIDPLKSHLLKYDPELLATSAASWHDEQPFSTAVRPVPRFEPPAPDDPDNGTLEARRRGPFTVGVAVETRLPESWGVKERAVRVAALGQAGLFTGPELGTGQGRLLLDTCNWLLGREEQLARPAPEWSYPRLAMSPQEQSLWLLGARWGLPEAFAFLGLVMLLVRRLR